MNCRKSSNVAEPSMAKDHKNDGMNANFHIIPTFEVKEKKDFAKLCVKMVEATAEKGGDKPLYYNFTTVDGAGAKVFCREAYPDAAAVIDHMGHVGEFLALNDKKKYATMTSLEFMCTEKDMKATAEPLKAANPTYWVTDGLPRVNKPAESTREERNRSVSLYVVLAAPADFQKFLTASRHIVNLVSNEPATLNYELGQNVSDKKIRICEMYKDAAAVKAHLANVGEALGAALKSGDFGAMLTMDVHGPKDECEKLKEDLAAFKPTFWHTRN